MRRFQGVPGSEPWKCSFIDSLEALQVACVAAWLCLKAMYSFSSSFAAPSGKRYESVSIDYVLLPEGVPGTDPLMRKNILVSQDCVCRSQIQSLNALQDFQCRR